MRLTYPLSIARLFGGTPLQRATVDLAHVTEVQPVEPVRPALDQGHRSGDLTKAQLAKLRKLSPAFARAEKVAQAQTREIAQLRRRHKLDGVV